MQRSCALARPGHASVAEEIEHEVARVPVVLLRSAPKARDANVVGVLTEPLLQSHAIRSAGDRLKPFFRVTFLLVSLPLLFFITNSISQLIYVPLHKSLLLLVLHL